MSTPDSDPARPEHDRAAIKERVYATFTGLAIVLVQNANVAHTSALQATVTLLIGIVAIALAGFAADLVAHLATHGSFPRGARSWGSPARRSARRRCRCSSSSPPCSDGSSCGRR